MMPVALGVAIATGIFALVAVLILIAVERLTRGWAKAQEWRDR